MNFLKKIFSFLDKPNDDALLLYVQCDHCKAVFQVRIDLMRDLENTYGEGTADYKLKKEAMDNKCFRLITISMEFDRNRKVLAQQITNGTLVSQEDYEHYHDGR